MTSWRCADGWPQDQIWSYCFSMLTSWRHGLKAGYHWQNSPLWVCKFYPWAHVLLILILLVYPGYGGVMGWHARNCVHSTSVLVVWHVSPAKTGHLRRVQRSHWVYQRRRWQMPLRFEQGKVFGNREAQYWATGGALVQIKDVYIFLEHYWHCHDLLFASFRIMKRVIRRVFWYTYQANKIYMNICIKF